MNQIDFVDLTDASSSLELPQRPRACYLILSFEIALSMPEYDVVPLVHTSYHTRDIDNYAPGVLCFPFTAMGVPVDAMIRLTTCGEVRELFRAAEKKLRLAQMAKSYLYQLGLTSYSIEPEPPKIQRQIIELKESTRDAGYFKCYKILRYSVKASNCREIVNLVDPYCLSGYLYLPVPRGNTLQYLNPVPLDNSGIKHTFKGLPVVSNVSRVLERDAADLHARAIPVTAENAFRRFNGLLVRVDIEKSSGLSRMFSDMPSSYMTPSGPELAETHEIRNFRSLTDILLDAHVQHYALTGDGFIAGIPFDSSDGSSAFDKVRAICRSMQLYAQKIDPDNAVDFRCAFIAGCYSFGRIDFRAWSPGLVGPGFIRVSRLEEALRDERLLRKKLQHVITDADTAKTFGSQIAEIFDVTSGTMTVVPKGETYQVVLLDLKPWS